MRFRRRDDEATPGPAATTDGPEAVRAGVLDGRRLWVAVAAEPGALALRDVATGDVLAPPDDGGPGDDQPGYLSARLVLDDLPVGAYDVVLVPPGPGTPRPLRTPPLPPRPVPLAPDGTSRLALVRTDDGTLRVRRDAVPAAVDLSRVRVDGAAVVLGLAGRGSALRLVGDDDAELASWPLAPDGPEATTAAVTADGLDGAAPQVARLLLDDRPVRRRAHDLPDPARAAPLPQVGRLRLRWSGRGLLQGRLLDVGEADA